MAVRLKGLKGLNVFLIFLLWKYFFFFINDYILKNEIDEGSNIIQKIQIYWTKLDLSIPLYPNLYSKCFLMIQWYN